MTISSSFEIGKRLRGQYIAVSSLPSVTHERPLEFCLGLFYPEWPYAAATNRAVLEELKTLLITLGVEAHIYPFVNCECRYCLSGNVQQWKQVSATMDYSI